MEKQVIVLIVTIVAIIAFVFIKGFFDTKRNLKNFRFMLKNSFGQPVDKKYEPTQYQNISKYHQKNRGEYDVDDITWNDLNMDNIYMIMNLLKTKKMPSCIDRKAFFVYYYFSN